VKIVRSRDAQSNTKKAYFLPPSIAIKHWVSPLTEVSAYKVPVMRKKFVSKEVQNSTLEAAILKLYLAANFANFVQLVNFYF